MESSGSSIYHGLALSASKRYSNHYQLQVSFTLGKAIDDTADFITDLQPANQLDLRNERSLSSFDQRHRLVISGVPIRLPALPSRRFYLQSGHPFNLLLGFDANGDTKRTPIARAFAGRNTGRGPNYLAFDLRLAKAIALCGRIRSIDWKELSKPSIFSIESTFQA